MILLLLGNSTSDNIYQFFEFPVLRAHFCNLLLTIEIKVLDKTGEHLLDPSAKRTVLHCVVYFCHNTHRISARGKLTKTHNFAAHRKFWRVRVRFGVGLKVTVPSQECLSVLGLISMKIFLRTAKGWSKPISNRNKETCDIDGAKLWIGPGDQIYCDIEHNPEDPKVMEKTGEVEARNANDAL